MISTGAEVAVAVVVVVLILIVFGVFIGLILYYGCGIICCCHNESYDVCERAAQERVRKAGRGSDAAELSGSLNPLERGNTSVPLTPESPLSPLGAGQAAPNSVEVTKEALCEKEAVVGTEIVETPAFVEAAEAASSEASVPPATADDDS